MDVDIVGGPGCRRAACTATPCARRSTQSRRRVFAVVATGGTTNFGIVDDIASIAEVTPQRGVWLHVDGAYGLAAMLRRAYAAASPGVERADSVIVDPHKWLFAPFDAAR